MLICQKLYLDLSEAACWFVRSYIWICEKMYVNFWQLTFEFVKSLMETYLVLYKYRQGLKMLKDRTYKALKLI